MLSCLKEVEVYSKVKETYKQLKKWLALLLMDKASVGVALKWPSYELVMSLFRKVSRFASCHLVMACHKD